MKWILISLWILMLIIGCQNFPYYDPAVPHHGKSEFYNNYDNSPKPSFWKWQWERLTTSDPPEPPFNPEIIKTDLKFLLENKTKTTLTWIGHASALLQINGINILLDPVFSDRISPLGFLAPERQTPVPFQISEMPPIDVVLISHNHYDHLDLPTLETIAKKENGKVLFLVPLGDQNLLNSKGILNVKELDWWQQIRVKDSVITFIPSQHWSQRTPFNFNKSLWGGWHISISDFKFLYTGDTGYSKDFTDIHDKLGSVDLAMIPIGCYEPRWFMEKYHVNPEEAVRIHQDLHAKQSIGVHWGTFRLSDEPLAQPPMDLGKAILKLKLPAEAFRLLKHGETMIVD